MIENNPTSSGDVPIQAVEITDSGELSRDDPSLTVEAIASADGDSYEDYPDDEDHRNTADAAVCLEIAQAVREVGNRLFKEGKTDVAFKKYESGSRSHLELTPSQILTTSRILAIPRPPMASGR